MLGQSDPAFLHGVLMSSSIWSCQEAGFNSLTMCEHKTFFFSFFFLHLPLSQEPVWVKTLLSSENLLPGLEFFPLQIFLWYGLEFPTLLPGKSACVKQHGVLQLPPSPRAGAAVGISFFQLCVPRLLHKLKL